MEKVSEIVTHRYQDGDFIVEITKEDGTFEAYLSHKNYGVKSFIAGVPEAQIDGKIALSNFERIVEDALEDHERYYREDYMDE